MITKKTYRSHFHEVHELSEAVCSGRSCSKCVAHTSEAFHGSQCLFNQYKEIFREVFGVYEKFNEVHELTVDQVSKLLGYKVKIVGSDQ